MNFTIREERCVCAESARTLVIASDTDAIHVQPPISLTGHTLYCPHYDIEHSGIPGVSHWDVSTSMHGLELPPLSLDGTWSGLESALSALRRPDGMDLRELLFCLWRAAGLNRTRTSTIFPANWDDVADLLTVLSHLYNVNGLPLKTVLHVPCERNRPLGSALRLQEQFDALDDLSPKGLNPRLFVVGTVKTYKSSKLGCGITLRGLEVVDFVLDQKTSSALTNDYGFELLGLGRHSQDSVVALLHIERRNCSYVVIGASLMRVTNEWLPLLSERIQSLINQLRSRNCDVICIGPGNKIEGHPFVLSRDLNHAPYSPISTGGPIQNCSYWNHHQLQLVNQGH